MALVPFRDERSHSIGERAALVPSITTGDMIPPDVTEDTLEIFFHSRAGGWYQISVNLLYDSDVNPSQSALWKFV